MGKSQRTKGASGERELCALLSDAFGETITRNLGQARDGGHDVTLPPYRIECKRRKRIGLVYDWLTQANADAEAGEVPIVMARSDGGRWFVCMYLPDWIKISREELAK